MNRQRPELSWHPEGWRFNHSGPATSGSRHLTMRIQSMNLFMSGQSIQSAKALQILADWYVLPYHWRNKLTKALICPKFGRVQCIAGKISAITERS
jgi:hypothetical protein